MSQCVEIRNVHVFRSAEFGRVVCASWFYIIFFFNVKSSQIYSLGFWLTLGCNSSLGPAKPSDMRKIIFTLTFSYWNAMLTAHAAYLIEKLPSSGRSQTIGGPLSVFFPGDRFLSLPTVPVSLGMFSPLHWTLVSRSTSGEDIQRPIPVVSVLFLSQMGKKL